MEKICAEHILVLECSVLTSVQLMVQIEQNINMDNAAEHLTFFFKKRGHLLHYLSRSLHK